MRSKMLHPLMCSCYYSLSSRVHSLVVALYKFEQAEMSVEIEVVI